MSVHRTVEGSWAECSDADCVLPFHVPDLTLAEVEAIPLITMLALFEAVDPPHHVSEEGRKDWGDRLGLSHRDYGLPARVYPDGAMEWWVHGKRHREGDLPAIVLAGGSMEWWVGDESSRPSGGPTVVDEEGVQRWAAGRYGLVHRVGGPAIIHPDGREEFWEYGERVS